MPEISVIVPVYNVEKYLARCLDSILSQTFTDFELLLVDDGSPDRSGDICEEYAQRDSRVRVFHKTNGGQATARNLALDWAVENSDSKWVHFVDSDDYIHPRMLEVLLDAVKTTGAQESVCSLITTEGEPLPDPSAEPAVCVMIPEHYYLQYITPASGPCAKLIDKARLKTIRFREGKVYEDAFTMYRIHFSCEKIAVVDYIGYAYFNNCGSTIRKPWGMWRLDHLDMIQEQIDFFTEKNKVDLRRFLIRDYIKSTMWQLHEVSTLDGELARQGRKILIKRGRRHMRRYRRDRLFDRDKDGHIYWTFFPITSRILFYLGVTVRKITKIGRK